MGGAGVAVGGGWVAVAVGDGGTGVGVRVGTAVGLAAMATLGDAVGADVVGVAVTEVGVLAACCWAAATLGSGDTTATDPCRPQATRTRVARTMTWTSGASRSFIGGDHSRAGRGDEAECTYTV